MHPTLIPHGFYSVEFAQVYLKHAWRASLILDACDPALQCARQDARAAVCLSVSRIRCFCHPAARASSHCSTVIHRGASLMSAFQRGAFCSNSTSFQTPLTSALAGFPSMQFEVTCIQVKPVGWFLSNVLCVCVFFSYSYIKIISLRSCM